MNAADRDLKNFVSFISRVNQRRNAKHCRLAIGTNNRLCGLGDVSTTGSSVGVAQGHDATDRCCIAQGHGVGRRSLALHHTAWPAQGHGGHVAVVHHGVADAAGGGHALVVAAAGTADTDAQRLVTLLIGIVGPHRHRLAVGAAAAHRNGDLHPVGEGYGQRTAGHRVADAGGVDNAAALGHGLAIGGRAQGHRGGIHGVGHLGGHLAAGVQLFIVATAAAGDAHRQAAAIFVNVVTRGIDRHTAA